MNGPIEIQPIGPDETPIWVADPRASDRHAMFDHLLWRGLVLGTVENFGDGVLFYAWVGSFPSYTSGSVRLGGYGSLEAARDAVRANAAALLAATVQADAIRRKEVS